MVIPMPEQQSSPLARLALFMVCLSIAGGLVAGAHYAAFDLPLQKTVAAPHNENCETCEDTYMQCFRDGGRDRIQMSICDENYQNCQNECT